MKFLTFDLGTTLFKVAVFDEAGQTLALRRVTPPIEHARPDWWEIHPQKFKDVLIEAAQSLPLEDVAAVSFATQANSFVLLDDRDVPLTPLILWPDQRAAGLTDLFEAITALPGFRSTTGMPRFGPQLALAKVARFRRNDPPLLRETRRLCFISDYLTRWLSGRHATEGGVAGLSGALDIRSLQWWPTVLERLDVPPNWLPNAMPAGTDLGEITVESARELGLPRSCRFITGSLDQYAGAIGTGAVSPGAVCETTGTVLAAVRCADHLQDRGEIFEGPGFAPDRFFQMSFSSTSANLLEWYRNQLPVPQALDELTTLADNAPSSDLVIEPFDDRGSIAKSFRNVRPDHSVGQVVHAIMQCVADSLKQQIDQLCGDNQPRGIRSAGGAARNDFWLQLKATTLGIPFIAPQCEEPTSLGAAMLAARAMGLGSLPELASKWVRIRRHFLPLT